MRYLCVLVATLAGASAQTTAAAPAAPPDAVAAPKPTPVPTPEPTPEPTPAPIVPARGQCEALQTLFEKTRGASWQNNTGWMTTHVSCCKWHGITCDAEGFITKIELPFNKLAGVLPDDIGGLARLENLQLDHNSISGTLPRAWDSLAALEYVFLGGTFISGTIPPEYGSLKRMVNWDLGVTSISGTLPESVIGKGGLHYVNVALTQVSGTIPHKFFKNPLDYVNFGRTSLSGTISDAIGKLDQLDHFYMEHTAVSGTLPDSIKGARRLYDLDLEGARLSGTLPPELGEMTRLDYVHFGKCVGISGTIPQTIAGLTRVDYIDLESTKAYHPQPAPLPIGLLERMRDLVSCELTKATTDALEWNTNHFYCAADVHETFASYPAACVPLQYQICAADYWIAQLAGAAVGTLLVLGLLVFCAKKARDNCIRKRSRCVVMRDVALLLALLRAAPAAGKGLHEHDGGPGGRDGRRTKPWRASEACVATGGAAPSVAIIGAGGNIGSRLHEVLSANCGWKVTGYDREPRLSPPRAKYPITPMSAASIPAAELAAYDAVVYLGGLTGRAACDRHTREQTLSENVDDPLALASRMGPSQLLVFASTSAITEGSGQRSAREDTAVRTELLDSYSSSMHQREAAMRQLAASKPAGAPQLVGLRFGTVIGVSPGQRVDLGPPAMLKSAYTTGVLKVAHPETSRAFLWLEDLCRGISRTIELRRGGAAIAPPATAHHSKRSAPSSSSMAPAAPPPFAIYHLSSFNSNVGALAAAIAARTGARIAASNHGTASKDVLGFSLNNSLFARTYNFRVRGSLATAIRQLDGAVPDSLIGKGAHTMAVHVPPAADEPTPTDATCDGFKHDHAHCPHALTHAPPPPATNSGGVNVTSIRCPVCGSHDIQLALDLRGQPLANDFMKTTTEALRAEKFPLALVHCRQCHHMHLSQLVSRKRLFSDYMYVSGTSKTLLKHFEWLAQKIQADVETLPLEGARTKRAVLELACNDGSQLDAFARLGWKTYGVDPAANIVPTAVAKGHQVKVGFWGAQSVWPPEGKPVVLDAIVAQNVLAHVPSPTQFLKDCAAAMGPRTLLFIQTSQCAMHEDGQFDTAYHEHLSFFTSHSFERAATAAQLAVLSFETAPIHGISCLWKLKRADGESSGALAGGTSLRAKLDEEVRLGITTDFFYERYRMRAEETSAWLDTQLAALSAAGYRLGGYGAAAKGMVLLHFMLGRGGANAAAHSLEFVLDDAPMKQGTYCPGTTIPVRPTRSLEGVFTADEKPLALVMFAWNFAAELFGNLQKLLAAAPPTRSGRPRVVLAVLPFPTPRVVTLEGDTVAQMHYHPAQIGATYRGLVGAAGARRAVLLTSFADDAAVLPHWIRHHAHMFDEAMLLDCGSADASGVIIEREAPPTWRVVRAPNASSALHGCAHHLASHAAAAALHDWVFPLQLHELLVHGDLRGALAALDGQAGPPPLAATLQFPALQMAVSSAARAPADRFTDLATQRSQYHPAAPLATFRATTGAAKRHASGQVQALSSKDGFVLVYPPISTAHGNSNRGGGGRDAAADADTGDLSELYEVIARGPRPAGAGGPSGLWPTREAFALHRIFHEAGLSAPPQGRARQRRKRARQAYD